MRVWSPVSESRNFIASPPYHEPQQRGFWGVYGFRAGSAVTLADGLYAGAPSCARPIVGAYRSNGTNVARQLWTGGSRGDRRLSCGSSCPLVPELIAPMADEPPAALRFARFTGRVYAAAVWARDGARRGHSRRVRGTTPAT
jgi:hypothetical protein